MPPHQALIVTPSGDGIADDSQPLATLTGDANYIAGPYLIGQPLTWDETSVAAYNVRDIRDFNLARRITPDHVPTSRDSVANLAIPIVDERHTSAPDLSYYDLSYWAALAATLRDLRGRTREKREHVARPTAWEHLLSGIH